MVRNVRDVKKTETKTKQTFFHSFFYYYSQTFDNLEFIVVKVISGKRDILPRFWTFTTVYMTSALDVGLALLGELTVYIKKAGQARRVILPSKKGDPARRVTLQAEPTFCFSRSLSPVFSCERFAKFWKEMYEELAPALGSSGGWVTPLPCKRDLSSFYRFKWCGMTAPNLQFQGPKTRIEHARHKLGT